MKILQGASALDVSIGRAEFSDDGLGKIIRNYWIPMTSFVWMFLYIKIFDKRGDIKNMYIYHFF
jgi:hypothetical protein